MAEVIEQLAGFVAGIRYEDMPREDVAAIQRLLLDTLGCALGAVHCEPAALLDGLLTAPTGPDDRATLIGGGGSTGLASAILVNGARVRHLDFMDVYWARDICHPSENIPVALAGAEAARRDGRCLIETIAAAYEVQVRLADAFSLQDMGLHHVSVAGLIAPLMLGKLWGLPLPQRAHAAALGAFRHLTLAALAEGRLSMAKALGYALPASECVLSTRLAARGFSGPSGVLEGLWKSASPGHAAGWHEALDLSPGTASARRVSLKRFPVQFTLQSPIEAALALREALGGELAQLETLRVGVHADVCRRTADPAKYQPQNRETADHSMPCCVALALLDGRVDTAQFEEDRCAGEDVRALMQRIRVEPDEDLMARWPRGRPARLSARLCDGRTHELLVETPLGDIARPMSEADVERKFMDLAVPALGHARAAEVVRAVHALPQLRDVGALCELLAPPSGTAG